MNKMEKTKSVRGPKFIHIMSECSTGWGFASDLTVEAGELAFEAALWYLAEYENGQVKMNVVPKTLKPIEEYQKRDRFRAQESLGKATEILKECGADGWASRYERGMASFL